MKNTYVPTLLLAVMLLLVSSCKRNPEKESLVDTVWVSQPYESLFKVKLMIAVELRFYQDSVTFSLPHSMLEDVAGLLGGGSAGKETHYSWDYTVEKGKIELDPGFLGYSVPLEMAGDSLVWKGKLPYSLQHLSLRKVQ